MRTGHLISVLGLLALGWWSPSLDAQQKQNTPTCDVHLDLQYELQKTAHVTLAGQMEVAPEVVQVIMSKAGEMHWHELTKHGRKYPGICLDDEHPYYVLVWNANWGAEAGLHVLDNGCLVYPSVFGTVSTTTNREKAIKKVFEAALRFLAENGKQPAPPPLYCIQPKELGPLGLIGTSGPTKYKLKALRDICKENRPAYTEACRSPEASPIFVQAFPPEPPPLAASLPPVEPASNEGKVTVGTGFFVSEHGYILTNAQSFPGADKFKQETDAKQPSSARMSRLIWHC